MIKNWDTFIERVIAGVASGVVVGVVLIYLLPKYLVPAVVAEMQKQQEAFISQHYYPEITVEEQGIER